MNIFVHTSKIVDLIYFRCNRNMAITENFILRKKINFINIVTILFKKIKSVAYSSQGTHTGQLDFCFVKIIQWIYLIQKRGVNVYDIFRAGGPCSQVTIPDLSPSPAAGIFRGVASAIASEQTVEQPHLKITYTDAGETSGIFNPRTRLTSPKDTMYLLSYFKIWSYWIAAST